MTEYNNTKLYNESIYTFVKKAKREAKGKECVWSNNNKTLTVYTGETIETEEGLTCDSKIFTNIKPFKRLFERVK